ncbi:MAG: precorrin-6A/cobalt-precorrin-6A reductase [Crocinitomicaceae bacterium]|nr:precorrin-6A/cobalt-precorrin-6A reductase [Crocinitomicaceae bacterium]
MILLFGGTTEGKRVISLLNEMQLPFLYSTKTKVETELGEFGKERNGALDFIGLKELINSAGIKNVINASHPFAQELHQTIDKASKILNIRVLRLERIYSRHIKQEFVTYANDYKEIIRMLVNDFQGKNLLALTGVQSIERFKPFWKDNTCYFRILDRQTSLDIAERSDFPINQLIMKKPENLVGNEEELIDRFKIDVIVTKESGTTGKLEEKVQIAMKKEIRIIILKKPITPPSFIQIQNIEELKIILKQ